MAPLVCMVLMLLTIIGISEGGGWCVCRSDVGESSLQKTLDYACGAGADCSPIQQGGACFNPNNVKAHCSFAVNSFFQRKAQAQQACVFSSTAMLTSQDPSSNGCTYPATPSAAGTSSTNTNTNTPTSTTNPGSSSTTLPGSTTPNTSTPNSGTAGTGGLLSGSLGPSGMSSTDTNDVGPTAFMMMHSLLVLILSSILFLSGKV